MTDECAFEHGQPTCKADPRIARGPGWRSSNGAELGCASGLARGGFKVSQATINAWMVAQQRMSGLASLDDPHGAERSGKRRLVTDLRSVSVGSVLARTADCSVSYRRDDRAERERRQDGGAAPFAVSNRLADGNDERGQDNHGQQRARLARSQRRRSRRRRSTPGARASRTVR